MPIIQSLLDTDFYKFTMGHWVFKRYPNVPVRYAFKNRTARVRLAEYIDEAELRRELDHVRTLRVNPSELHYLRGTNEYGDRHLQRGLSAHSSRSCACRRTNWSMWTAPTRWNFLACGARRFTGRRWRCRSSTSCIIVLALERLSAFERDAVLATGTLQLAEKIKTLRSRPDITFSDFGTRRRFSRSWQEYVVRVLAQEMPGQLLGTSNTAMAMQYGLLPIGTLAHEMYMVLAGVMAQSDDTIRASHNRVLQEWWEEYGWGLSIALTDTYGTDFFFRDMTAEQARAWKGLRQDSGDPMAFGEKAIAFYERHGIDPRDKLIVFSDGLDLGTIVKLADHFAGRIRVSFGWGTNLTNDVGFEALSLVIKVIEAHGHRTVKLSDNLAKATGEAQDIERFKRIFGHTTTLFEECKY